MKLEKGNFSLNKTLNQREIVMFSVVILLMFFGYYRLYVISVNRELAELQTNISRQDSEKERLERQIKLKKSNIRIVETSQDRQWLAKKEAVETSIQAMVRPVHLAVEITDFKSEEVGTKKRGAHDNKTKSSFKKRGVNLVALGSVKSLGNYIEYIENLEAPLVVEGISLAPNPNQPGELILRIEGGFYVSP